MGKCAGRDRWIGRALRHQHDRLHLIGDNARSLILPGTHDPNLASRVLPLCGRRVGTDWQECFGHLVRLPETFVAARCFHGTNDLAANWLYMGEIRGFRRK